MGATVLSTKYAYTFDGETISNVTIYDDFKKFSDYSPTTDYIKIYDGVKTGYIYCSRTLHNNKDGQPTDQHFATFIDRDGNTTYAYKTQLPDPVAETYIASYTADTTISLSSNDYPNGIALYAVGTKGNNGGGGDHGYAKSYVYTQAGWQVGADGGGGGGGAGGNGGVTSTLTINSDGIVLTAAANGGGGAGGGGGGAGGIGSVSDDYRLSGGNGGGGGISNTIAKALKIEIAPSEVTTITLRRTTSSYRGANGSNGGYRNGVGGTGGAGYGGSAGGGPSGMNGGGGGSTSYNPDGSVSGDTSKLISAKNMRASDNTRTNAIASVGGFVLCRKNAIVYTS